MTSAGGDVTAACVHVHLRAATKTQTACVHLWVGLISVKLVLLSRRGHRRSAARCRHRRVGRKVADKADHPILPTRRLIAAQRVQLWCLAQELPRVLPINPIIISTHTNHFRDQKVPSLKKRAGLHVHAQGFHPQHIGGVAAATLTELFKIVPHTVVDLSDRIHHQLPRVKTCKRISFSIATFRTTH